MLRYFVLLGTLGVLVAGQDNGGVIEVKNGDLRINLGEVGGKVYVSVKGGPEIELFALAARVKALEDAAQSNDGNDTGMQDDLDNLRVKVDKNEASAIDLDERLTEGEAAVDSIRNASQLWPVTSSLDARLQSAENKLTNVQQDLSIVPQMAECASQSKIYHPEDGKCTAPSSVHCEKLATDGHSGLLVTASALVDPEGCSFNQHYGGQSCGALCLPGALMVPNEGENWEDADVTFGDEALTAYNLQYTCLGEDQVSWVFEGGTRNSYVGTKDEAQALCKDTPECKWLHDYNSDNKNFRVCKHVRFGNYKGSVYKVNRGAKYKCGSDGKWESNFKCSVPTCTDPASATELQLDSRAVDNGATVVYRKASRPIDGEQNSPEAVFEFKCPRGKVVVAIDSTVELVGTWSTCTASADGRTAAWSKTFANNDCGTK